MELSEAQWNEILRRISYLEGRVRELDTRTFKLVRLGEKYY